MRALKGSRPVLRLVEGEASQSNSWAWFCGHCASPAPVDHPPRPGDRVCRACGFGLMLETRADCVPGTRDAFLVVDHALLVQAMSRQAQQLLSVCEEEAVNRPLSELLVSADAEAREDRLTNAVRACAHGGDEPQSAFARPWNTFGVRIRTRVAPCGPTQAALVVLGGGGPGNRGQLRAV